MAENIFNEKQDYIVAARDEVIKRDEYAANIDRMKQQQKKLSRSIASEEKSIADEIATTIKKRRQDIQSTYDDRRAEGRLCGRGGSADRRGGTADGFGRPRRRES